MCHLHKCDNVYHGVLILNQSRTYTQNVECPITEPCGTPQVKSANSEVNQSICTH